MQRSALWCHVPAHGGAAGSERVPSAHTRGRDLKRVWKARLLNTHNTHMAYVPSYLYTEMK